MSRIPDTSGNPGENPAGLSDEKLAERQRLQDLLGLVPASSLSQPSSDNAPAKPSDAKKAGRGSKRKTKPASIQQLQRQLKTLREQRREREHQPLTGAAAPAFGRTQGDEDESIRTDQANSADALSNAGTDSAPVQEWLNTDAEVPEWMLGDLPEDILELIEESETRGGTSIEPGSRHDKTKAAPRNAVSGSPDAASETSELTPERTPELTTEQAERLCRETALRLLSTRARSRHEIEENLRGKELPAEAITHVMDRFEEVGLIDDEAFAQAWVESRNRSKGYASARLAQELRRKGIAEEHIAAALEQLDGDELRAQAESLALKRLGHNDLPPDRYGPDRKEREKVMRRIVSHLQRKGYAPGVCMAATRSAMERHDNGERG
ncbi:regulatory protein RecX [Pseudoglutamicibacter cumminsii]|uniref:regulatory protein RecX n=1 Tax=Pseudoglutamicibacter cumminsii TaxID=156979 RepID=UPI001959104E|nr:regulatory protein RecX [Pseudoglutamicibacter cumminsii]MBM7796492.1 SOS response regulatory protein OraA/RecX [Pseudoglutamicibacter cumminsii]